MRSDSDQYLVQRWQQSPWKEGIEVLIDPNCTKAQMDSLLKTLYPHGDQLVVVETFRGRGEFCDFRGLDLSGMNLRKVCFLRCDLSGGNFARTDLVGTYFTVARLQNASFAGVVVNERVGFEDCFARGADFSGVHLVNADFSGAELVEVDFTGATLERCDFGNASLQNAKFDGTRMIDCNVQGARFSIKERDANFIARSTLRDADHIVWVD